MDPTAPLPSTYLLIPVLLRLALVGLFLVGTPLAVVVALRWLFSSTPQAPFKVCQQPARATTEALFAAFKHQQPDPDKKYSAFELFKAGYDAAKRQ